MAIFKKTTKLDFVPFKFLLRIDDEFGSFNFYFYLFHGSFLSQFFQIDALIYKIINEKVKNNKLNFNPQL